MHGRSLASRKVSILHSSHSRIIVIFCEILCSNTVNDVLTHVQYDHQSQCLTSLFLERAHTSTQGERIVTLPAHTMAQYTQLEKIRQELDEAYQNEPEYDSDGFPTMKGMNRGSYFDFPNDFMDFASSHKRYLFSQRAKFLVLVLSIALIVVTVVRAIVGWATLYHLTGRIFILLPLAIEVFFNLLFAGFGTTVALNLTLKQH